MRLAELTESVNVKRILRNEAEKLENLADVAEKTSSTAAESNSASKVIRNAAFTSKIINYGKFYFFYIVTNSCDVSSKICMYLSMISL